MLFKDVNAYNSFQELKAIKFLKFYVKKKFYTIYSISIEKKNHFSYLLNKYCSVTYLVTLIASEHELLE